MSSDDSESNDRVFRIVGGSSAVMQFGAFTVLGVLALEHVTYGATMGLFAGVGAYLFLPWFLRLAAVQNESGDDLSLSDLARRAGGNSQLSVFGLGLELGAIAMLAAGFVRAEPDPVYGTLVALAVALAVFLVASVLLGE